MSPICSAFPEASGSLSGSCAASFADTVFFANSGAEAMECAIKMARKYQAVSGKPERVPDHHVRGRLSRPHARDARRWRAAEISRRLRPGRSKASIRFLSATSTAVKKAITPETGAIIDRADPGRGRRARAAGGISQGACASSATSTACCWSSTRCRPASAAPENFSPMSGPGVDAGHHGDRQRVLAAGFRSARVLRPQKRPRA